MRHFNLSDLIGFFNMGYMLMQAIFTLLNKIGRLI